MFFNVNQELLIIPIHFFQIVVINLMVINSKKKKKGEGEGGGNLHRLLGYSLFCR